MCDNRVTVEKRSRDAPTVSDRERRATTVSGSIGEGAQKGNRISPRPAHPVRRAVPTRLPFHLTTAYHHCFLLLQMHRYHRSTFRIMPGHAPLYPLPHPIPL